jgi:hypothetical protein
MVGLMSVDPNTQLARNVLRYAQARPSLHAGSVEVALVKYLIDVCGTAAPRLKTWPRGNQKIATVWVG